MSLCLGDLICGVFLRTYEGLHCANEQLRVRSYMYGLQLTGMASFPSFEFSFIYIYICEAHNNASEK